MVNRSEIIKDTLATNEESLVKEFSWRVCFPDNKDHSGHAMGEVCGIIFNVFVRIFVNNIYVFRQLAFNNQ